MIVELGHYALVLALALSLVAGAVPVWGARDPRRGADGRRAARPRFAMFGFVALAFAALTACLCAAPTSRSLNVVAELAFGQAADLQDHRRLGQPRRLDAALGADPRRCSARWSRCRGATCPLRLRANVLARAGR